ncbi:MAG TPA: type II toxin-antitoxin system HicB family antitoxin [Steroidobacteraceae bacterium]
MNPAQIFENYPFEVKPLCAHGGRGYVISFPDLPGCMCVGQTVEEAIANGRDAFHAWMASAIADGAQIPRPNGAAAPVKFVQRLPKSLHAQLLRAAASEGTSVNTFVTVMLAEGLSRRERPPSSIVAERERKAKTSADRRFRDRKGEVRPHRQVTGPPPRSS